MPQRPAFRGAAAPGLRADPRHPPHRSAAGQVDGVGASPGGLHGATLGAAAVAGVILTVFWLPAEYGIDPTGLGAPTGSDPALLGRIDRIDAQLAAIAGAVGAEAAGTAAPAAQAAPAAPAAIAWRDQWSYTLDPGQGVEAKLVMEKGAVAEFEWTANGGVLTHDTHGDGGGQEVSYVQGLDVPGLDGRLTAAFSGNHGWLWLNRTEAPVTVTLRTRGDYQRMLTPEDIGPGVPVSFPSHQYNAPQRNVSAAIEPIAHERPKLSAMRPAESAPIA